MQIFIKAQTGLTFTIEVESTDTILDAQKQYQRRHNPHEDPSSMRWIFAGKTLDFDRTFGDYKIQKESTIHNLLRLSGGGGGPSFDFASMTNMQTRQFSSTAPNYRAVRPGMFLLGYCKNRDCKVFNCEFVCNIGFDIFDAQLLNALCVCPKCKNHYDHNGMGFYKADVGVDGVRESGETVKYNRRIVDCKLEHLSGGPRTKWIKLEIRVSQISTDDLRED